jgi:hypothetical protein
VIGEKPAPLQYQFQDSAGVALPIVGYTVKFNVREQSAAGATQYNGALIDGPNGIVGYTWLGTEFLTPGTYLSEFWTGNGAQRYASWVITFQVRSAIGTVPNI